MLASDGRILNANGHPFMANSSPLHPRDPIPTIASTDSYIDAQTYCDLAISPRRLERTAEPGTGVICLRDVETGERFVVERKALAKYKLSPAS